MRDRLIKLLQDNSYLDVLDEEHWLLAAEQLLTNGVVVIDADVVSPPNRPLISQYMGRPIDEVINLIRRSEWISVEERLPQIAVRVLITDGKNVAQGCVLNMGDSGLCPWVAQQPVFHRDVTHWMPLPEPPKKGGEE